MFVSQILFEEPVGRLEQEIPKEPKGWRFSQNPGDIDLLAPCGDNFKCINRSDGRFEASREKSFKALREQSGCLCLRQ
jgi:hypothetical protein